MTSEDDFQSVLDADPEDRHTRLVFADWLEERDDPRAPGYRALARLIVCDTTRQPTGWLPGAFVWMRESAGGVAFARLPDDWFDKLEPGVQEVTYGASGLRTGEPLDGRWWRYPSRRRADDAAAVGFSKLPTARQAELLRETVRRRLPMPVDREVCNGATGAR